MTRYVSPLRRASLREVAHTTKVVAGAISMVFVAIALAAIAVGAIGLADKIWSW